MTTLQGERPTVSGGGQVTGTQGQRGTTNGYCMFKKTPQAAAFLNLSPKTLERWRLTGNGPAYRKHGRVVVYAQAELEAWSEAQIRRSTSDPDRGA